jgi:L-aspartate oxidase
VANRGPIVVIGAGLAGLFTALRLAPRPVTVIAAEPLGEGASSAWAQGGIAAAVGEGDSPEAHAADTIRAGAGIVDAKIAHMVAAEAPDRVRDLLAYGVPFDRDLEGHFLLSREAAHSAKRIVRVSGDRAGYAVMQALITAVRQCPSIHVLEGFGAIDLIKRDGRAVGAWLARKDDPPAVYELSHATAVVLATGGIGGLYAVTTNPPHARGSGLAIAARAGAVIRDAEFVQFHPTAIDIGADPAPLATEALRGEGAILINRNGERFMPAAHPDAELAPRDIVARAVFREIAAGHGAFLDCRAAIGARFAQSYPTVYARCRQAGLDPATEPIPIAPAEHYHMGGVKTDAEARTSVAGLWAVGEVACTGLHGANRLASNSLIEAVVFGARAAQSIAREVAANGGAIGAAPQRVKARHLPDAGARKAAIAMVRATMAANAGVERNEAGLMTALDTLARVEAGADGDLVIENAALAARFIVECALRRRESRGAHFRSDFPEAESKLARSSSITRAGLELRTGLAHALFSGQGGNQG